MAATLLVAQDPILARSQDAPATTVAPVEVDGVRLESGVNTRASDPPEQVICRDRPTTGSRFNHRRCRTRAQAGRDAAEARRWMGEALRGGPSDPNASNGASSAPL